MRDFKLFTVGQILDVFREFIPDEDRIYKATETDIQGILG